jgi:hypothetical protein
VQKNTVFCTLTDEDGTPITPWFGEEIIMLQATAPHFVPTKILVPVDFSSSSDAALETASDLAQHFHAELYLLNVIPMLPVGTKTVSFSESEYVHKAEGNAERRLATCDAALVSKGFKASSSIEIGNDVAGKPEEILLTEAFHRRFTDLPQVACFDTAFHHDLPRVAQLLPIPRRYEARGVRRYGFHGLSYAFLIEELARIAGREAEQGRVILAHLGNGASLAAVHHGKSIDTSMSFTPAAGVPMSTRSGDVDPGLVWYLARTEKMSAKQSDEMVNFRSGLLGVSETSSDMRDLLKHETQDVRAAEAVALFCYQVKKWIGAFAAALGGLDTLAFAGGIGENAPVVRARTCEGLRFLGIELSEKRKRSE